MSDPPEEGFDDVSRSEQSDIFTQVQTTISSVYKVLGEIDAPDGTGVLGNNTAATGVAHGVEGYVDSRTGDAAGVYGEAGATTGAVFGVRGVSHSAEVPSEGGVEEPIGAGVHGESTDVVGVLGRSQNHVGVAGIGGVIGVRAHAGGTGLTAGLWATHDGDEGSGVQSLSTYSDTPAETEGVMGRTQSFGDASSDLYPVGVRGTGESTSGITLGVRGDIVSRAGPGVVGVSATSGYTFSYSGMNATGVTGIATKTSDASDLDFVAGVEGVGSASGTSYGVFGRSTGDGYGLATPDDAQIEGIIDSNETDFVVEAGTPATGDATNVVLGHGSNQATSGVVAATISGGGYADFSLNRANEVSADRGTVGGGSNNTAGGLNATVGGGDSNTASAQGSTVGGGSDNEAGRDNATVSGGLNNTASEYRTTIAGGRDNTASEFNASVGGGFNNTASGSNSTVPGGIDNFASGDFSFAAGRAADTNGHSGTFVWGDGSTTSVTANASDQVVFQAGGSRTSGNAVEIYSQSDGSNGVRLAANDGTWQSLSSRAAKTDVDPVAGPDVLEKVQQIDVSTWRYDGQDESVRHMGPMAEEFHETFGLGTDEETIAALDLGGTALAAIQGLSGKLEKRDAQIEKQADRLETVERENEELRQRLDSLEAQVGADVAASD